MNVVLQIGDRDILDLNLHLLLTQYQLLPQLAKELIIDEAIAAIECSPEETVLAQQQFYQKYKLTDKDKVQTWINQRGMTHEQLARLTVRDLKIEKFKQSKWAYQIESYFLQCKGKLDRVVYSLIRTKDHGIAQELYFRIQEGENSFEELARQYSEGVEAQTGGLIGPVQLNVPHPQMSRILSTSQLGQLSKPAQIGQWWIILRLDRYLSAQLDESTRKRLLNELFQGWLQTQMQTVRYKCPKTSRKN